MPKYAAVVTHMQLNSDCKILFPFGDSEIGLPKRPISPFSDEVIDFLNQLSSSILKDRDSRKYSDVVTFAFFCRKGHILKLKSAHKPDGLRLGRGNVFHIAPGNVPVNFAYSLVAGLLSGNNNIVKLSTKPFPQVDIIIRNLEKLRAHSVSKRIVLIRYPHNSKYSSIFSQIADARIIWGGDNTIETIRKSPSSSRCIDICFADRYSFSVIDAAAILSSNDKELKNLSERFYNDTFLFDQNACSAPHLIVWIGSNNKIKIAKDIFWKNFHDFSKAKYPIQPIMSVDKLTNFYRQSILLDIQEEKMPDNLIVRAKLNHLSPVIEQLRCNCGYFLEYETQNLFCLLDVIDKKYQTLCYYGNIKDDLIKFIEFGQPNGIDRIVPIGETSSFSLVWDGYDLISFLSREISVY